MQTVRFYRSWPHVGELEKFEVSVAESDLMILCDVALQAAAMRRLRRVRGDIEWYAGAHPGFLTALAPYPVSCEAPPIVRRMAASGDAWRVGPMAAVAGAVAQAVGEALLPEGASTVIVENGGDVFAHADTPIRFALYAGETSPFSRGVIFEVNAAGGVGVCTSSGSVGHSLSFGKADAVVAVAPDAAFADAAATAIANRIRSTDDIESVIGQESGRGPLRAIVACLGDKLGVWGDVRIVEQSHVLRRGT